MVSLLAHSRDVRRTFADGDFTAFYCGGTVVRERLDPYRAGPLERCERERTAAPGTVPLADGLDPAPLPGYALLLFVPFSLLPFFQAALVWYALAVAAIIATVELVRALTALPRWVTAAALLGTGVVASVTYGQLAPPALVGIVGAALLLARDRPRGAALVAALTLLQPQLGAAVMLALLIWVPRARVTVLAVCAALGTVSLLLIGPAANAEYARAVLPAQALAEAPFDIQLSLTWLAFFAGAAERAVLQLGSLAYAVTLVAGVALGKHIAGVLRRPEAIVVVPAALAVSGGTYLHVFQLAAAVPCALFLAARAPRARVAAWVATALLAVPWEALGSRVVLLMSALAVAAIAFYALRLRSLGMRVLVPAALAVAVLVEPSAVQRVSATVVRPPATAEAFRSAGLDPGLASTVHGQELRRKPERVAASWRTFAQKSPDWLGLAFLLAAIVLAAVPARRDERAAVR